MPPRSFFAQKVTVRPRSAAASTWAKLPSMTMSGSGVTKLQHDPRQFAVADEQVRAAAEELVGHAVRVEQVQQIRNAFVLFDAKQIGGAADAERGQIGQRRSRRVNSTPSSGKAATILGLSMRMVCGVLRSEQNHQLVAGAADVARADGQDGVAGARFVQQVLDAFLHGRGSRRRSCGRPREWRWRGLRW